MGIEWIKRILVVGAGTMGHSIAMAFAQGGYQVALVDVNEEVLKRAMNLIQSNLETLEKAGWIDSKSIPNILDRIRPSATLEAAKRADLVVEAISEDPKAKK